MDTSIIILRFAITFVLAVAFGLERQRANKPIGFGTFTFVAVGACALGVVAMTLSPESPLGLLSAIVTGIGFLGAGALIRGTDKVFGFTTAASIWVLSIFGLAIGIGDFLVGGVVYIGIWLVTGVDEILENKGIGSYQKKIIVTTNRIIDEKEIRKNFNVKKCRVSSLIINKAENRLVVCYIVAGQREEILPIPGNLYSKPWFESMKID